MHAFKKARIFEYVQGAQLRVKNVEIIPAVSEHERIVNNLFELYVHDFSEFHHLDLDHNGRFRDELLSFNLNKPRRYPFLILVNGNLAGFVFIKRGSELCGSPAVWDIAEFFVVRTYRRQGIGTRVAHELWRRFPGPWEIRVMMLNCAALRFWGRAVEKFFNAAFEPTRVERDNVTWCVYAFISSPTPAQ